MSFSTLRLKINRKNNFKLLRNNTAEQQVKYIWLNDPCTLESVDQMNRVTRASIFSNTMIEELQEHTCLKRGDGVETEPSGFFSILMFFHVFPEKVFITFYFIGRQVFHGKVQNNSFNRFTINAICDCNNLTNKRVR